MLVTGNQAYIYFNMMFNTIFVKFFPIDNFINLRFPFQLIIYDGSHCVFLVSAIFHFLLSALVYFS